VLTHYHYDHTGGVRGFGPDVKTVGHARLEKNLRKNSGPLIGKLAIPQFKVYLQALEAKVKDFERKKSPELDVARKQLNFVRSLYDELNNFKPFKPDITFKKKRVIELGGETVELIHMGSGHTDDSCLVYFPEKKILHTGDLFVNGVCPFVDELAYADVINWISILNNIIDHHQEDTIVPGHGKPGIATDVTRMRDLLRELKTQVQKALDKGLSLEQTRRGIDLPSFKDLQALDLLKYDIEAVYNTLKRK
jgi:glyoxylase-like metal-dependent hydrolase (beta-lactamase superfamily II)